MPVTLTIDDELATELEPYASELSKVLALGIREFKARGENGYSGVGSVLEKLAALPTPEEVLALRPSPPLQERIEELLERNRTVGLSSDEQREWNGFQYVEHLVRLAKAKAAGRLRQAKNGNAGKSSRGTTRRRSVKSASARNVSVKKKS